MEVYIFYIALLGMAILLSYKVAVIKQYDKVNKNHILFDPFPPTRVRILKLTHAIAVFFHERIIIPVGVWLFRTYYRTKKRIARSWDDMRHGRHNGTNGSGVVSGYMRKVVDQKRKIQKRMTDDR